jgi:hypothetical protein
VLASLCGPIVSCSLLTVLARSSLLVINIVFYFSLRLVCLVSCPSPRRQPFGKRRRTRSIIIRIMGNLDKLRDMLLHYALARLGA